MDERDPDSASAFLQRGIRKMDTVVVLTSLSLMSIMCFLIYQLDSLDLFILNLLNSIQVFMLTRDWRNSSYNLFFGWMYLFVTFKFNVYFAVPGICAVLVAWVASCHRFGYPSLSWVFFFCLVMWVLKWFYSDAPNIIVILLTLKTVSNYVYTEEKNLEDVLIIIVFILLYYSFVAVKFVSIYLFFAYFLSFIWMWFKAPVG